MRERHVAGTSASPGRAAGAAWGGLAAPAPAGAPSTRRPAGDELADVRAALAAAADELAAVAARLGGEAAAIVETGVLIAEDPALIDEIAALLRAGSDGPGAILTATGRYAEAIASLGDETLAARADDVRSLGRRATRHLAGASVELPSGADRVLLATDLGPGDVAELAGAITGVGLAGGAVTAHAAIVARALGIPMVTGLGDELRAIASGVEVVIDGDAGTIVLSPGPARSAAARHAAQARRAAGERARHDRELPAETNDGTRITVLTNAAAARDLELGFGAGAEGVGLLRTELAFLDATSWPTEAEHRRALAPVLDRLAGRPAVVRVLDFGADKAPPFLHGVAERGIALLLAHREALAAQLSAIVGAGAGHGVRVMLPLVEGADQLRETRELLAEIAAQAGVAPAPPLGAMVETVAAVEAIEEIVRESAFISIGTNDLTASVLATDRFSGGALDAHHPRVLAAIARTTAAAQRAGRRVEVCGEAASYPLVLPLLVGLGVDELSVGAARVGDVRRWIRRLSAREAAGLARSALTMDEAGEVARAARPLAGELTAGDLLGQPGEHGGERRDGGGSILAVGLQP